MIEVDTHCAQIFLNYKNGEITYEEARELIHSHGDRLFALMLQH